MPSTFDALQDYFQKLQKKAKSQQTKSKLLYLVGLNTEPANKALEYIEVLDRLLQIYISPTGKIGVNGVINGLMYYKEFFSE
jgi:hypothetical protein